jgi:hypothetical protein
MNIGDFFTEFDSTTALMVKILFLIGLAFYIIFALVVVRQVNHMTDTLEVGFETPVRLLALLHLLFVLGTFVLAIFIL